MSELILNDDPIQERHIRPADFGTGLDLSARGDDDYAYGAAAEPFLADLIIDRSEWQAIAQEMEQRKSRLSDRMKQAGLPSKNQGPLHYCWIFAVTHCLEIVRMQQNEPMVTLSPPSAGALIKNFRDVGGWGKEGIQWISDHGVCPVSMWPEQSINRQYATTAAKTAAMDYRIAEWMELKPNNLDQLFSMLLRRIPVAIGLPWWGHEVTAVDPVWLDGAPAIRCRNSWGEGYGDHGYFILQGSKMMPNDACCPRTALMT